MCLAEAQLCCRVTIGGVRYLAGRAAPAAMPLALTARSTQHRNGVAMRTWLSTRVVNPLRTVRRVVVQLVLQSGHVSAACNRTEECRRTGQTSAVSVPVGVLQEREREICQHVAIEVRLQLRVGAAWIHHLTLEASPHTHCSLGIGFQTTRGRPL